MQQLSDSQRNVEENIHLPILVSSEQKEQQPRNLLMATGSLRNPQYVNCAVMQSQ
jgi:hypothetical protein